VLLLLATGLFLALGLEFLIVGAIQIAPGLDYRIYMDRSADFVAGRGFYLPRQLSGPYLLQNGDAGYPPPALILFVPFLWIPAFLWWLIPIGIVATIVVYHRPSIWVWPLMSLCMIAGTGFANTLIKGNPTMWVAAAVAVSTLWRPAAVLVLLKPTLLPFALFGARSRGWWVMLGALAIISLPFLPMWPDFVRAVVDARGRGWEYTFVEATVPLVPLIAWWGRTRREPNDPGPGPRVTSPDPVGR
jgi:hypothetical protein